MPASASSAASPPPPPPIVAPGASCRHQEPIAGTTPAPRNRRGMPEIPLPWGPTVTDVWGISHKGEASAVQVPFAGWPVSLEASGS